MEYNERGEIDLRSEGYIAWLHEYQPWEDGCAAQSMAAYNAGWSAAMRRIDNLLGDQHWTDADALRTFVTSLAEVLEENLNPEPGATT